MVRPRVIPSLLLKGAGLVKTVRFSNPRYIGDPINSVKLFNDLEVDELAILDIDAARDRRAPDLDRLAEIVSEAFMPIAYGGGVESPRQAEALFKRGAEKVIITTAAARNPAMLKGFVSAFGGQSIVGGIDVKSTWWRGRGYFVAGGSERSGTDPATLARTFEDCGIGEILVNSIDRDGTMAGYDTELIRSVAGAVRIPVIASGGAGSLQHVRQAIDAGASAAAAGSLFVYKGPHRAVLVNYPSADELIALLTPAG
jgi:cyclase